MQKCFKEDVFEDPPHLTRKIYHDLKINTLCFVRTNETYFDRDITVDHVFDYYEYPSLKKVTPHVALLMDHLLTLWDREVFKQRRNH